MDISTNEKVFNMNIDNESFTRKLANLAMRERLANEAVQSAKKAKDELAEVVLGMIADGLSLDLVDLSNYQDKIVDANDDLKFQQEMFDETKAKLLSMVASITLTLY